MIHRTVSDDERQTGAVRGRPVEVPLEDRLEGPPATNARVRAVSCRVLRDLRPKDGSVACNADEVPIHSLHPWLNTPGVVEHTSVRLVRLLTATGDW